MRHGKRGFDRMVFGCKTISDKLTSWICTLEDSSAPDGLSYTKVLSKPVTSQHMITHQVMTPAMPGFHGIGPESRSTAAELYEWISLVRLGSPRVSYSDDIDSYISRYSAPDCPPGEMSVGNISWDGLFSPSWVSNLVSRLLAVCPEESWFAITATDVMAGGLGGKGEITVLKPPGQGAKYLMWDIKHI